jgi:hypothetical protein
MKDKRNILIIALAVCLMGMGLPAVSLAADVFAECAYRDAEMDCECYIYANTGTDNLISGGVMLSYNPADLTLTSSEKNEGTWYFGDGSVNSPYMDPEDNPTTGELVYIVGKLDINDDPQVGVNGLRVLIGTAMFTRNNTNAPVIGLALGRTGAYVNFVSTAGTDLDGGVTFGTTVAERGDANADGSISTADYITTRNLIGSTDFPPYADCNGDGSVSTADYICIRNKI